MHHLKPASVLLRHVKQSGFSNRQISTCISSTKLVTRRLHPKAGVLPFVKKIDTLAAEFPAFTNYNPETVSTDYDEADWLYFENVGLKSILSIYDAEIARSVILSMGCWTPNIIALPLFRPERQDLRYIAVDDIAENRCKLSHILDEVGVDQPLWKELSSFDDARELCDKVECPCSCARCTPCLA